MTDNKGKIESLKKKLKDMKEAFTKADDLPKATGRVMPNDLGRFSDDGKRAFFKEQMDKKKTSPKADDESLNTGDNVGLMVCRKKRNRGK